jgi:hypothetical protein
MNSHCPPLEFARANDAIQRRKSTNWHCATQRGSFCQYRCPLAVSAPPCGGDVALATWAPWQDFEKEEGQDRSRPPSRSELPEQWGEWPASSGLCGGASHGASEPFDRARECSGAASQLFRGVQRAIQPGISAGVYRDWPGLYAQPLVKTPWDWVFLQLSPSFIPGDGAPRCRSICGDESVLPLADDIPGHMIAPAAAVPSLSPQSREIGVGEE